ncbi:MAG: stage II sporulation protein R [Clostridia bacterium]|jgi:stage II sporulation protein R|nr:stage II sporulation protein R [Clostridia bacterium]MDD4275489.1 stage II sporulation protein R [Clostridia bacterium]
MKAFICILLCVLTICSFAFGGQWSVNSTNEDYIRIHIRANSNNITDQNIKFTIKDKITEYLTPIIAKCENKEDVATGISENLVNIENICTNVLNSAGFGYQANASLVNEYFPTRTYESSLTLNAGVYEALIVELGEAEGDNWWCVIYPPLCFVNSVNTGAGIVYKSKILELIQKFSKGR